MVKISESFSALKNKQSHPVVFRPVRHRPRLKLS